MIFDSEEDYYNALLWFEWMRRARVVAAGVKEMEFKKCGLPM